MTADQTFSDWPSEAIRFLSEHLPVSDDPEGWDHMCSSAYQMGCSALVALGHAKETEWGAVPLQNPRLPDVLPRWDDICVAVLSLAAQQNRLSYRQPDGSLPPNEGFVVIAIKGTDIPELPAPNIAAAHGLGPAHANAAAKSVLQSLGLIAEDRWSEIAETVLWRSLTSAWNLDFTSDPRFTDAVERTIETMPAEIRSEMDRLLTITDADVDKAMAQSAANYREKRAKYGPKAKLFEPFTAEQARSAIMSGRADQLDWLFYRRWRFADGWLTPTEAERAIEIFHDSLAVKMRCAVIARLYPGMEFDSR